MRLRPNILRPQRGLFIGGQSIPIPDLFDYSSRSGLNLVDALGGSNATILGGKVANYGGVGKMILGSNITFADAEDYTISFWIKNNNTTGVNIILGNNGTLAPDASRIFQNGTALNLYTSLTATYTFSNVFINTNWKLISLHFKTNRVVDLSVNGSFISSSTALANTANSFKIIGGLSSTDVTYRWNGLMGLVNIGNKAIYYGNNNYDSISGNAATTSGTVSFDLKSDYTTQSTTDALTDGYFQLSGGQQVVKPQYTLPVGAVSHVGGQVHNLISSFVTFPAGSSMDRSNTTIFNATCRASIYHDVSNPTRWHVSELNYDTMQTYLQSAYTNTRFASIKTNYLNQLYIDRFFAFAAPISGKTLTYYLTLIGK